VLHDASQKPIGALAIVFPYKAGDDKSQSKSGQKRSGTSLPNKSLSWESWSSPFQRPVDLLPMPAPVHPFSVLAGP